jgi:tartrate dehydrogenase/decarboxylase / D-malate dehydrogenase
MRHLNLAIIPADGIGSEVTAAARAALECAAATDGGIKIEFQEFDWGSQRYLRTGKLMPDDGLSRLAGSGFDAIMLGPVGDLRIPDHITLWGLLLPIRQEFDQYVNLRPLRLLAGVDSPLKSKGTAELDMVCMRENSEGEYAGAGGRVHKGKAEELAVQSIIFTRSVTERLMHFAFKWAGAHGRRRVTNVTKSNAMQHNMVFWDEIFAQVSACYPHMQTDQQLVDSMTVRMIEKPESVDVFVASNLFGDILTDLGAALTGSMGLAPSANLNPERKYPSLFQAIHGAAFDIAGKNLANPLASIWSAQLMLDFLGEQELSVRLLQAIERVLHEKKVRTPDLGGTNTTTEMTAAICETLKSS